VIRGLTSDVVLLGDRKCALILAVEWPGAVSDDGVGCGGGAGYGYGFPGSQLCAILSAAGDMTAKEQGSEENSGSRPDGGTGNGNCRM
jgi:hypothetical protein